ncbi:MAG TPA: GNAT family N-acetyltransferase, partial [Phycisphaerae bacterium]|nr:GNAT family N-acetyltransferase [Phycisphaerae bacterium]
MLTDDYAKELTLKNGRRVTIRLLRSSDYDGLLAFFRGLPDSDRLFLQHNVTDPELIRKWTKQLDLEHIIPLVVEDEGKIVADGTLHLSPHGWMHHVGQIRLAISPSHRHLGLGTFVAYELLELAEDRNIEKLYANVIEDDSVSIRLLQRLGFKIAAVLKDLVRDQHGKKRNLAIMMNDVADLGRILEDWI